MTIRTKYAKADLLGKARLERAVWDKGRKTAAPGVTRADFLRQVLGADNNSTARSNLLKKGRTDPSLWSQLEKGLITYRDALHKTRPSDVPPSDTRASDGGTDVCSDEVSLGAALDAIYLGLKELKSQRSRERRTVKEFVPPVTFGNDDLGKLGQHLIDVVYDHLRSNGFLHADGVDVCTAIEHFRWGVQSEVGILIRKFKRLQNTDPKMDWSVFRDTDKLRHACQTLGAVFETASDGQLTPAAYESCKRRWKRLAATHHPDRFPGGHTEKQKEEWLAIKGAWETIDSAYR